MDPRSPLRRLGWLFAAVFQLLLPTFASVADARAEAASMRGASIHVEAHSSSSCTRVHPADCVVCRVLATSAVTSAPASVHVPVARLIDAGPADVERPFCTARAPGDPPQRAPPVKA
ncbi:MAG: hypothetical protein M3Z10_11350 [Gemmatimonadota bacterium]|nr:hypothetical protein [Gemmatimonadota bacterium]